MSTHPFLYEAYGPARVKDTEKTLTITLAAAGLAAIVDAYARDEKGTKITSAIAGSKMDFFVKIRNDGSTDKIWIKTSDKDTGIVMFDYSFDLAAGSTANYYTGLYTMPNRTLNVLIEAGHGV